MTSPTPLDALVRRAREAFESLRRQAPGAKMIGEMTARFVSRDIARRIGLVSRKPPHSDGA